MNRAKTFAVRIVWVLVAIELVWLLGANLALRTDLVQKFVNRNPDKLLVRWESGSSWYPARVDLADISILLRSSGLRVGVAANHVGASLRLMPLLAGRAAFDRIEVSMLDIALARIPETAGEPADPATPEVEETGDAEAPASRARQGPRLRIDLEDVDVRGVKKVAFEDLVLSGGEPSLKTSLGLEIDGEMELRDADFDWQGARITMGDRTLAEAISVGFRGHTQPIDPRRDKGRALLRKIDAAVDLEGEVKSLRPLALLFPGVVWVEEVDGEGEVAVHVAVEDGAIKPGSVVDVDATGLALSFLGFRADGAGRVEAEVKEVAGIRTARAEVAFDTFQLMRQGDAGVLARGAGLRLETRIADLGALESLQDLGDSLEGYEATLEIPRSEVPDVSVLAGRLPEGLGIAVEGGSATLQGHLEASGSEEEAVGSFELRGDGLRGHFRDMEFEVNLAVETRVSGRDLDAYRVELEGTELRLFDGVFRSGETEVEEGWWLTVAVPEGQGNLKPPLAISADIEVGMRDTRALIALFAEVKRWIRHFAGILTVRDIEGTAHVELADEHLSVHELSLVGDKLDVMAELELDKQASAGIFHAEFGIVSLGAERIGEDTEFKLLNSRSWYEEQRAERWTGSERATTATPVDHQGDEIGSAEDDERASAEDDGKALVAVPEGQVLEP